jgi:uroporphyrinogen decarboxylase
VRGALDGAVPLIGFAGSPFTVATYLVEGGGSRSFAAVKRLLFAEPALAHALLSKCADTIASYLAEQVRAGAQAAMLFDTWCGILSPADYRSFALPYARRVFAAVAAVADSVGAAAGSGASPPPLAVPRIYYLGDAPGLLEAAATVGADVIGLDWRIGLEEARWRLGADIALQGNLDPAVLLGPPAMIRERAAAVLHAARGGTSGAKDVPALGHVFNLGHGILPETPVENAQLLVDEVRRLSSRAAS